MFGLAITLSLIFSPNKKRFKDIIKLDVLLEGSSKTLIFNLLFSATPLSPFSPHLSNWL